MRSICVYLGLSLSQPRPIIVVDRKIDGQDAFWSSVKVMFIETSLVKASPEGSIASMMWGVKLTHRGTGGQLPNSIPNDPKRLP